MKITDTSYPEATIANEGDFLVGSQSSAVKRFTVEDVRDPRPLRALPGKYFGIVAGANCTTGFEDWVDYIHTTAIQERAKLVLGPGKFYADKITLPSYASGAIYFGSWTIEGAGAGNTVLIPNTSSEPVFIDLEAGFVNQFVIRDLAVQGIGATNAGQIGIGLVPGPQPSATSGGLWYGLFQSVVVSNFDGVQFYLKGSQSSTNLLPSQFLTWLNCRFIRAVGVHKPTVVVTGQLGQAKFINCIADGTDHTDNAGPNFYLGRDNRISNVTVSAISTSTEVMTTSTHGWETAKPVRIIGDITGLASTPQVAKETTYFWIPVNHLTAQNNAKLATSAANAAAGTAIDFTNQGTPANYSFVAFWVDSYTPGTGAFVTSFAHMLSTTDCMIPRGTPPGAFSAGTTYFAIRTGAKTFKLATTEANARAGTAITGGTTGTPADYGFSVGDVTQLSGVYQCDFDVLTLQNGEVGLMLQSAGCVSMKLYGENLKRLLEAWGGSRGAIRDSRIGACADDGGNGLLIFAENLNTHIVWGENNHVLGTTDNWFTALNGPACIATHDSGILKTIAYAASITPDVRSGRRIQVATLTDALTVNAPINAIASDTISMLFIQDGTGGRVVTLNAVFKGATPTSGTGSQRYMLFAEFDGTNWNCTSTGWY